MISFGFSARATRSTSSRSMSASCRRTPYCTARNHLPERLAGAPWVRWPPAASDMPRMVSPGFSSASMHALVRLRAGMRLHVGEAAVEQLLGALDGELLGDVDELAAAVIAPAGIALGVFVGEHRALGLQHRAGDDVLRRDQLDLLALAAELLGESARRARDRCSATVAVKKPSSTADLARELFRGI